VVEETVITGGRVVEETVITGVTILSLEDGK